MSQMPVTPNYQGPSPEAPKGMAVASMVLGIVSFVLCFIPYLGLIAWVTSILAVVLGVVARGKVAKGLASGGGMATTGMILGIVWVGIALLVLILALVFGLSFLSWAKQQQQQHSMIMPTVQYVLAMLK